MSQSNPSQSNPSPLAVPAGFRLAGVHSGVKSNPDKPDLTLIVTDKPSVAAGVYTQNVVFAAPVEIDRARTPTAGFRALVVNSGNANACTGQQGLDDARQMLRLTAEACGVEEPQTLLMSTGIIGRLLPMEKISAGITAASQQLGNDAAAFDAAARGILTTDKSAKCGARQVQTSQGVVQITGMAKGAGMIGPNMATLLSAVLTDANLTPADAQQALQQATDKSFNCISVDEHTSTNDTALLLCSGEANAKPLSGDDLAAFTVALTALCIDLAKMIPDDGEGAKHIIEIQVNGAPTAAAANQLARTVASSNLVKTAITGADPNWGRIVSAAGYAGAPFDPSLLDLHVNGISLYQQGSPVAFDAAAASASLRGSREAFIQLDLNQGDGAACFWTSDLTVEYVQFNSEYTT